MAAELHCPCPGEWAHRSDGSPKHLYKVCIIVLSGEIDGP